jgi:predicted Zn finger-like uncharacterized protein
MSENYVAQCPNCRTRFRVSRAQLGAAQGAVRCGACLHVFNAARQIADAARSAAPAVTRPVSAPAPAVAKPILPAAPAVVAPAKPETAKAPPTDKPKLTLHDDELRIHDDLDLGDLDLDEELERLDRTEKQQLSAQFKTLKGAPGTAERLLGPAAQPEADDDAWAEALLRDEALDVQPDEPQPEPLGPARPATDTLPATPAGPLRAGDGHDEVPGVALHELAEAPLQLEWQKPKKPWGRWLLWTFLILLALAALAAQYVRHNFQDLARQDQYRTWFEQLCPTVGCSLPSRVDIEQIRSSNLVVRSHPSYRGALVVDAILYNRASFSQPFPLLELRFADIGGQPIANRRFKPSEYLSGELAGQKDMPSQTPIHISLEILDPGSKAVNYSLAFHSPE